MSKEYSYNEYSYNGKKYFWIKDDLDRSTGCRVCSFLNDVGGCDSMEACATVPYSYFVEAKEPNEETQDAIKEAREIMKEKSMIYTLGGKEYELAKSPYSEEPCNVCAFKNDDLLCDEAGNHCVNITDGYFFLHDKTKESKGDMSALNKQEGGDHYKNLKIQPVEYITANNMSFLEGNVIKYISRHSMKNGIEDIKKVIHYCELILQLHYNTAKENK